MVGPCTVEDAAIDENRMMRKPDFIIAGAPKCGTTALCEFLDQHPQVCISKVKEPRFFIAEIGVLDAGGPLGPGPLRSGTFDRGWAWYSSQFDHKPMATSFGEATTQYISSMGTPQMIHEHLPGVRLIFMYRDPVDRLYSHYWQDRRAGLDLPDFAVALDQKHPRLDHYFNISHYRRNIERFLEFFGANQMLHVTIDQLKSDVRATFDLVCEFIGVGQGFSLSDTNRTVNQQRSPRSVRLQRLITGMTRSTITNRLSPGIRDILRWTRSKVMRANQVPMNYPELSKDIRILLLEQFRADVDYVEALTCQDLSHWKLP